MIGGLSFPVNKKLSLSDNFDMIVYFDEENGARKISIIHQK